MFTKGVVRNIDDFGRVTLPKEMRRTMNLEIGDPVDIYFDNGVLCMSKYEEKVNMPNLESFTEQELMAELYRRQSMNGGNK